MKLLLDANISPRLVARLAAHFPGSAHVLDSPDLVSVDLMIWTYARSHDFEIVSKDTDFLELSLLYGPPPKVIFLRLGNCTTETIERALGSRRVVGNPFFDDQHVGLLVVDH